MCMTVNKATNKPPKSAVWAYKCLMHYSKTDSHGNPTGSSLESENRGGYKWIPGRVHHAKAAVKPLSSRVAYRNGHDVSLTSGVIHCFRTLKDALENEDGVIVRVRVPAGAAVAIGQYLTLGESDRLDNIAVRRCTLPARKYKLLNQNAVRDDGAKPKWGELDLKSPAE